MINEDRVKQMTQIAIFEKERVTDYQPALKYSRRQFVALHGWGGFFAGTLFFWLIYISGVIYFMGEVMENLSTMYMMLIGLIGMLCYAAYIIMHVHNTRKRARRNYKNAKRLVKELGGMYENLVNMYDEEELASKPKQVRDFEKQNTMIISQGEED